MNSLMERSTQLLKESKEKDRFGPDIMYKYLRPYARDWANNPANLDSVLDKVDSDDFKARFAKDHPKTSRLLGGMVTKDNLQKWLANPALGPALKPFVSKYVKGVSNDTVDNHVEKFMKGKWDKYKKPLGIGIVSLLSVYMLSKMFGGKSPQQNTRRPYANRGSNTGLWLR